MATKKEETVIEIKPIEMATAKIRVVGDSPLITHAWSAKAKREMLEKQIGVAKTKTKEPKNPIEDFASSMYWLTPMPEEFTEDAVAESLKNARFGFPVTAFKQSAISASYRNGWSKDMASLRGVFFIEPDATSYFGGDLSIDFDRKKIAVVPNVQRSEQLVEIHSDVPTMREDMVRLPGMGRPADIRYRAQFDNWYVDLVIKFNVNGKYSLEDIINIINAGGYVCGVGEWRPEKDGQYGMFHVETIG